jgi:ATP-dependent Clp protease adaptor protein ClpS
MATGTHQESIMQTFSVHSGSVVATRPLRRRRANTRPRRQPRYAVILWDDNDHTYQYVVAMMRELFGLSTEASFEIALTVDTLGRAACMTSTLEHAELKRDQIHSYGRDCSIESCCGSMKATIEPVPGD